MSELSSLPDADIACMARLRIGDDLALNEIMDRWQQKIANHLLRMTGNEADAISLAQETFVRVYESRERYQPTAAFSTWLFHIATNLAHSHFRWQSRHPTISLDAPLPDSDSSGQTESHDLSSPDESPSEKLLRRERANAVRQAILTLPEDQREALVLFEYEDLSYEQIAEIAKTSPKAVENRLYRARLFLKSALQNFLKS